MQTFAWKHVAAGLGTLQPPDPAASYALVWALRSTETY